MKNNIYNLATYIQDRAKESDSREVKKKNEAKEKQPTTLASKDNQAKLPATLPEDAKEVIHIILYKITKIVRAL